MQIFYKTEFPLFPNRESSPKVPYQYFIRRSNEKETSPEDLSSLYTEMLELCAEGLGLGELRSDVEIPHNVILTTEWMMLIPRRKVEIGRASVAAAAMLGLVWVMDEEQLGEWIRLGPSNVLSQLGIPRELGEEQMD